MDDLADTPPAAPGPVAQPLSLAHRIRRLGTSTAVYILANGLIRGATILLVPLYTRALKPGDYGVLAVTTSVTYLLTVVLSLSLDSAITRMYFEAESEPERQRLYTSILVFLLTVPLAAMIVIEILGSSGYLNVFRSVPYSPYLRYACWTAYLSVFMSLPIGMWVARERPRNVLLLRVLNTALVVAGGVTLIVALHQGVLGALRAALAAAAVTAIVSILIMLRNISRSLSRTLLRGALLFSIPIVPHLLSHWLLELSDRVVLQNFVNNTKLGLYSLGYTVGGIATLFTSAYGSAVVPIIVSQLKDPATRHQVPRLGTYSLVVLTALCLALALLGGTAVILLTPTAYHPAASFVPWIASSYIFVASYMIVSQGSWFSMRTGWIAVATLGAAIVNVALTLALAPALGTLAGAVSTLVGYAVLAVFQGIVARRLYHIRWEYGRWAKVFVAAGACVAVGRVIGDAPSVLGILARCALVVIGFPLLLSALMFWTGHERAMARTAAARAWSAVAARGRKLGLSPNRG
ncbi:MAG TPA: lipopolysaccharide biosynthesis protein [Solirubrobacteraceae bacterium]|nr:lipopolysaccharide biosynthesis protein [Solirubrobacteraceae bacterium]